MSDECDKSHTCVWTVASLRVSSRREDWLCPLDNVQNMRARRKLMNSALTPLQLGNSGGAHIASTELSRVRPKVVAFRQLRSEVAAVQHSPPNAVESGNPIDFTVVKHHHSRHTDHGRSSLTGCSSKDVVSGIRTHGKRLEPRARLAHLNRSRDRFAVEEEELHPTKNHFQRPCGVGAARTAFCV
jgi:hypothetical protein